VVKRITGAGGDPVIQLQTAFGGGKTHPCSPSNHLARGTRPGRRPAGRPPIPTPRRHRPAEGAGRRHGHQIPPNMPGTSGGASTSPPCGRPCLAARWRRGQRTDREAEESGTSPGKETLAILLVRMLPAHPDGRARRLHRQFDENKR
jgi:hypothetical protein